MTTDKWKPEDDPEWCIKKLREIANRKCARFDASSKLDPFCGDCDSCFAGRAILGLLREKAKEEE